MTIKTLSPAASGITLALALALALAFAPVAALAQDDAIDHSQMDHSQMDHSQMDHSQIAQSTVEAALPTEGTPALWRLSDEDTTIYLFGTIHILPENVNWFDDRLATAFDASDELVFEIDMDEAQAAGPAMMQRGMLENGQTVRSLMTEENRAEYEAALADLGVPAAALDQFEPWMVSLNLSMLPLLKAGYQPDQGVEMVLRGRADGKERAALETVDQQIDLFDTLPMDKQLVYLDDAVEAVPGMVDSIEKMKVEWLEGDADGLAELMNEDMDDPEIYDLLLTNRNANWVDWIEHRLEEPGTVFIAVGAGHLAGRGSVQSQLEERGHTVSRVQ
ncbi:TraB/GumN family protein [Aurantiacibacter spongiae]|uniref:TraB/GumN family protein n=1 Tax=Aurantiacibacter spongiae TaxID=2488860 RepID=A0A3N5CUL8_9SPHN|nr:TraB/GumN family protein [Aurantiacibacter spongiae]RPF70319.1 TraB/GumN family protein [Aurantiacibacter spongiae]